MRRIRAYLIGFEPRGLTQSRVERTRLMQSCDFNIMSDFALEIGATIGVGDIFYAGDNTAPNVGQRFRVVATEHLGKVVVLEPLASN